MAKITWNGWRDHPTEKLPKAYEFLTGRNLKPFNKVFGRPENSDKALENEIDDQDESVNSTD